MACSSYCEVQFRHQDISKLLTRFDSKPFADGVSTSEKKDFADRFSGIERKFSANVLNSQPTGEFSRNSSNNSSESSSSQKNLTSSSDSNLDKIVVGNTTSFPVRSGFRSSFMIRDILKDRLRRETATSSIPKLTSVSIATRLTPEVMIRPSSGLSTKEFTESNDDDEENESDDIIENDDDDDEYNDDETTNSSNEKDFLTASEDRHSREEFFPRSNQGKRKAKKTRKARTAFTDQQLRTLEQSFDRQKYLSVQDRMELAANLNLSDIQVKTWYQNRRTKWKRQTAVGLELLSEAGNYAAVQRMLHANPYWATPSACDPHTAPGLVSSMNAMLLRHATGALRHPTASTTTVTSPRGDQIPARMLLEGLQRHVPRHQVFASDACRITALG